MPIHSRVDEAKEIPDPVNRGITWSELLPFASFVEEQCNTLELKDTHLMKTNPKGKKCSNSNQGKPLQYKQWTGDSLDDFLAEINMYDIIEQILKPMTKGPNFSGEFTSGCSFVEIVSGGPQPAEYFVSHFYGQPFFMFISALKSYVKRQALNDQVRLWISAFAHRPWCVEAELGNHVESAPFVKVIQHQRTVGTILVTSPEAPALKRLWCLFEAGKSMQRRNHDVDIVIASVEDGESKVLRTGNEAESDKLDDDVWDKLTEVDLEKAGVTKFADKHFMMSSFQKGQGNVFQTLIARRIGQPALAMKVAKGDATGVQDLLDAKINVNASKSSTNLGTVLHQAVAASNVDMVKLLLQNKADINNQDNKDRLTPLHKASTPKVYKVLQDAGADKKLRDVYGKFAEPIVEFEAPPKVEEEKKPEAEPAAEGEAAEAGEGVLALEGPVANEKNTTILGTLGEVLDDLVTLLATEKPETTKVAMKWGGGIRLPRKATKVSEPIEN